jgi:hypothetical protein
MIEQALYEHLQEQAALRPYLTEYNDRLAVFNQEAPADADKLWKDGPQYGRIVFAVDIQGDPERAMGGTLAVDIMCKEGEQYPEEIEPIIRRLIHGYFFSSGTFVVAAQWKNSSYFTQPTDKVKGCTVTFELLAFPMLTTSEPDVIARLNEWTDANFEFLHVINLNGMPDNAWKPEGKESAVYWRLVNDNPASWIPDTFQTIWRTANVRCHIFSKDNATAGRVARAIAQKLYADKRLMKAGESPIMVNRKNTVDFGADPLRTGQLSVEATYGVIVHYENTEVLNNIYKEERNGEL